MFKQNLRLLPSSTSIFPNVRLNDEAWPLLFSASQRLEQPQTSTARLSAQGLPKATQRHGRRGGSSSAMGRRGEVECVLGGMVAVGVALTPLGCQNMSKLPEG